MDNLLNSPHLDRLIDLALEEDIGPGDVTTQALIPPDLQGRGPYPGQGHPGGGGPARWRPGFFISWMPDLVFEPQVADGQEVAPGTVLALVTGPVAPILTGERVALNFLQRLSGIATFTRAWLPRSPAPPRSWWTPARPPRAGGPWRSTRCAWAAAATTAWGSLTRCSSRTIT